MIEDSQLESIIAFNFAPAEYADESWLAGLPHGSVLKWLQSDTTGLPWISRYILESHGLLEKLDVDFSRQEKRLALMKRQHLSSIVFHAGLALNAPLLKGILKRQERNMVGECLGHENYCYAIKKGPFVAGTLVQKFNATYTINWNHPEELRKHIFRTGVRLLGAVYSKESDAFQKRLLFKLPIQGKEYFYAGGAAGYPEEIAQLGSAMLRKLMKELGP
ncbi:MAG: SctK family type III secretion system sorting platform protein [Kistimonas sp.]|nr:SctK family type III secretion system sorting platform protein [Kistimonas sp.]